MKKTLFTLALAGVFCFSYNLASHAADVTFTKPGIKVNTSQEESGIAKKLQQVENTRSDVRSHENAFKKDINDTKSGLKDNERSLRKDIKDTKSNAKSKKKALKKSTKTKEKKTKGAVNALKNTFK